VDSSTRSRGGFQFDLQQSLGRFQLTWSKLYRFFETNVRTYVFIRWMKHVLAVKMTGSGPISVVGSEFNVFLFARVGEDRNNTPLSVLSALARLNLDPWQEAAELAQLPRESATQRLASSIAALADGPPPHLEHGIIAARLIALLPRQSDSESLARGTVVDASDVRKFRAGMCMYAIFFIVMMTAQWIAASLQAPTQTDNTEASASRMVSPQLQSPNSGQ
jgi:hypothetical protein